MHGRAFCLHIILSVVYYTSVNNIHLVRIEFEQLSQFISVQTRMVYHFKKVEGKVKYLFVHIYVTTDTTKLVPCEVFFKTMMI